MRNCSSAASLNHADFWIAQSLNKRNHPGMNRKPSATLSLIAFVVLAFSAHSADDTVKVFLLAGQSNMEGKAKNELITHQATDSKTAELFKHLTPTTNGPSEMMCSSNFSTGTVVLQLAMVHREKREQNSNSGILWASISRSRLF